MVLITKDGDVEQRIASKMRLLFTTFLGVGLLSVPILLLFVDPISFVAEYNLRLENGSMLHDLLLTRLEGPKIHLYLFNVTNAEEFMSGRDEKVKLEEVGPFVYQEYRTNDDLEINKEPGIMRYTPKLKPEMVFEESIGRPEDVYLTVPNVPFLAATALMGNYPFFLRHIFNTFAASVHSKAFVTITAHDHLFGYSDPLINLANTVVPGLIYFKSVGILERIYDYDADYRLELGTKNSDTFSVKKVTRFQSKERNTTKTFPESTETYTDSYEGAAFPPHMTPEMPVHIYRHSICKTLQLQYAGSRDMYYGGKAFVYHIHNTTFNDHQQCDSKGWCPDGLKNMAPCYFGIPYVVSKGHFLDADPRLLNQTEGLKADKNLDDIEFLVDPNIGISISSSICLQVSLFLADVGYSPETRRLKDTVLPLTYIRVNHPRMLKEVRSALRLLYTQGPNIVLASQILCTVLGLGLLGWSARMLYWNKVARNSRTDELLHTRLRESESKAHWPLLFQ